MNERMFSMRLSSFEMVVETRSRTSKREAKTGDIYAKTGSAKRTEPDQGKKAK
ncbi:hypothetical protein [Geobacillus stearothermophilus]|uniref:hypothetical protein n=1 Tax=Geobacillus stearothermophilus TaxID=1422 RepID=UPI002E2521D8|nr:hypothetical protein [Geobacillus stearothermophilus]MED4985469.1 hypothetical protein [Geobacillus stearothermophilus]